MKIIVWLKLYWVKFITWLNTVLGVFVYNFHKKVQGVKTHKNISYKKKGNFYQKMDIHYPIDTQSKKPIIVYFHGGGWTAYSKHIFTTLTRRLAKMGYVVFNCNYSLAPKYKMSQILSDALLAIEKACELAENYGGDKNNIILAGDSAGAHISAMVMADFLSAEAGYAKLKEKIKALILLYGVYDLETALTSGFSKIKTYTGAAIEGGINNLKELKKFSPIQYDLSKFPPCFLASGCVDKLHETQTKKMYNELKSAGVKVEKLFFNKDEYKAIHAYMIVDGISTNVQTLERINIFLGEVMAK